MFWFNAVILVQYKLESSCCSHNSGKNGLLHHLDTGSVDKQPWAGTIWEFLVVAKDKKKKKLI